MDLPWGDEKTTKFVTNVGLITTDGPAGPNIMAAEWTHHISYSPGLIMVNISTRNNATAKNIDDSKEFGISLAADDQSVAASVAGGSSGTDTDKIGALRELGVEFYSAKKISVPMVKGAALNLECKLVKSERAGSHTMFIGEVVDASTSGKSPLVLSGGRYWALSKELKKPDDRERERIGKIVEKHRK